MLQLLVAKRMASCPTTQLRCTKTFSHKISVGCSNLFMPSVNRCLVTSSRSIKLVPRYSGVSPYKVVSIAYWFKVMVWYKLGRLKLKKITVRRVKYANG